MPLSAVLDPEDEQPRRLSPEDYEQWTQDRRDDWRQRQQDRRRDLGLIDAYRRDTSPGRKPPRAAGVTTPGSSWPPPRRSWGTISCGPRR